MNETEIKVITTGDFAAGIPEGNLLDNGKVVLQHKQHYSIYIENSSNRRRCDVEIQCDGKEIGIFRLNTGQHSRIERPVHDDSLLTFHQPGTRESKQAGMTQSELNGIVSIRFIPEKERKASTLYTSERAEATDLSTDYAASDLPNGNSHQTFRKVNLIDLDETSTQTIKFPLVAKDNAPRPLTDHRSSPEKTYKSTKEFPYYKIKRWQFTLGSFLCGIFMAALTSAELNFFTIPFIAGLLYLGALRLHDAGRHWAWTFLFLIPYICIFAWVACFIAPSKTSTKNKESRHIILILAVVIVCTFGYVAYTIISSLR